MKLGVFVTGVAFLAGLAGCWEGEAERGPAGEQGLQGAQGAKGDSAPIPKQPTEYTRKSTPVSVPAVGSASTSAACDPGDRVVFGGCQTSQTAGSPRLESSYLDGQAWACTARNDDSMKPTELVAHVTCEKP